VTEQPSLFDLPEDPPQAHARRTDPDTSHQAAASLGGDTIRRSQAEVLAVLKLVGPSTDTALVTAYEAHQAVAGVYIDGLPLHPQSESGIRTRRRELVELGKVRDSGGRVRLVSGRMSAVWEAVPGAH
jgi:hypothetical protein